VVVKNGVDEGGESGRENVSKEQNESEQAPETMNFSLLTTCRKT